MVIEIPSKLLIPEINFVLIEPNGKKPLQANWQKKKMSFDDKVLKNHLKGFGNYGVRGGGDKNLVIVDFDNKEVQEDAIKKLPETFTVKTGSGLLHKYYFSDKSDSFKIFTEEMDTIADIQGKGKQVVGAGSTHPNGNKYKIVEDKDIAFIAFSELKAIMMSYDKKPKKEVKKFENSNNFRVDDFIAKVQRNISMEEVLREFGVDTSKNPTNCPLHSSKGGKCLGFNYDTAHCFHCEGSWNIFSFVMENKRCDFKEALEYLSKLGGLEKEYEENRKKWIKKKVNEKNWIDNWNNMDCGTEEDPMGLLTDMNIQTKEYAKRQPFFYDRSKIWWLWNKDKFCWEVVDETDILNMIADSTGADTISPGKKQKILNALKQNGRKMIPKPIKRNWIQFKDKIIDLKTNKSFNANPEYFVTNPIPWEITNDFETPTINKIFEEWVGKEYVQTLYEILAYCLIPDYPIHRIFCFIGGGMNGKSKFLELLRKFIGQSNVCSTELDILISSRFEITRLHKKLVCQMGETNFNEMNKTSTLKKLSGGDLIGFEYKNKDPFEEVNYAKILISTNNLPTTTDKTIGFYRRWLIIDFPNRFSEAKNILSDIPDKEYVALTRKCFIILQDLLDSRKFHNEGSVEARMKRYEEKSNPLEKFWNDAIIKNYDGYIFKYKFKETLEQFCKDNNFRELTDRAIAKFMRDKEIDEKKVQAEWFTKEGKKPWLRAWIGVKFK